MNFLDQCRHFLGLESTPSSGNLLAAEFVAKLGTSLGLHVDVQRESWEGVEQANVLLRPQKEIPKEEFMLQTHLDTVEAGHFGQWTRTEANPFNATIVDDAIYGLGAADVKLDILCKLEAAKNLLDKKLNRPFVIVGTFGAQSGMAGAIRLIRRKRLNAFSAMVGEPTSMQLANAGMGLAIVEVAIPFSVEEMAYRHDHNQMESSSSQSKIFSGKAAHSSLPDMGDNAIFKMLEYLSQLPDGIAILDLDGGVNYNSVPSRAMLEIDVVAGFRDPILPKIISVFAGLRELERKLREFTDEDFQPGHPTMNLGMVRTTAGEVVFTGSCRLPPSVTDLEYQDWMDQLSATVAEAGSTFRIKDYRRGFNSDAKSEMVTIAQSVLQELKLDSSLKKISMATEANVFHRFGIECLVWGPGQSYGNSHAPNERVQIQDLKMAVEVYRRILERVCL